jgi:Bacterial SH3 domain
MPRTFLACAAALVLLLAAPQQAPAVPVSASVRGVEAVNVRRGPGPETPAFVALTRGAHVLVEEVNGQWARVTLESGETGYINAAYLTLEPGATFPPPSTPTATPSPEGSPPQVDPLSAGAVETPGRDALERQLAQLRDRLNALESAVSTPPAGEPTVGAAGEAARPAAPLPTSVPPPDQLDIGPSLALAGVGLVVGFLLGTVYGQRQERHRRSRVRF